MRTVIVTTSFYKNIEANPVEKARFECAMKMCKEAKEHRYPLYIIEDSPDPEIRRAFESFDAMVFRQDKVGFGNSVRQCLQAGLDSGAEIILRTEIEKYGFVESIGACVERFHEDKLDVLTPRRRNLDGYPRYQRLSEFMAMWQIGILTGRPDIDWFFGPKFLSRKATERFIAYDGKHGDTWHILILPILEMMADSTDAANRGDTERLYTIRSILVDYLYSPEQAGVEVDNPEMDKKRDVQREQLVSAVRAECERLMIEGLP